MFQVSTLTRIPQTVALLLGLGSLTWALMPAMASESENLAAVPQGQTFLYGETAEANEPGQGYIVFQHQNDKIVGAFYYPQSEYSCFTGKMNASTLKVLSLPTAQDPISSFSLSMDELTAIPSIGPEELETLAACQREVTAFLKENHTVMEVHGF